MCCHSHTPAPHAPQLDKLRQTYSLKEQALAEVLAEAVGMDKESSSRQKLKLWRDTGSGRFKETAAEARNATAPAPSYAFPGMYLNALVCAFCRSLGRTCARRRLTSLTPPEQQSMRRAALLPSLFHLAMWVVVLCPASSRRRVPPVGI